MCPFRLLFVCAILLFHGCQSPEQKQDREDSNEKNGETAAIKTKPITQTRTIVVAEELKKEYGGEYLMSLRDSVFSLVHAPLYQSIPKTMAPKEFYTYFDGYKRGYRINKLEQKEPMLSKGNSYVTYKFKGKEIVIRGGLLEEENFVFGRFKMGMSLSQFMPSDFMLSDSLLAQIESVAVCEDERGENFHIFNFKNQKLHSIEVAVYYLY